MNYDANWQFEDWLAAQLQFRVQALPFLPCLYPLVLPEQPIYELMSTFRTIPVDGRGHPKDIEPSFFGNGIGKWGGDTLVIDSIGFKEKLSKLD